MWCFVWRGLLFSVLVAYALWFFTFSTGFSSFWLRLLLSVGVLLFISFKLRGRDLFRSFRIGVVGVSIGLLVGIALYLLLFFGYALLEPYVAMSAGEIYQLKEESEPPYIALLLVFTSIGEETYWRGFLLHNIRERLKDRYALLAATLTYSMVHVWTMNAPLMLIAFIAGAFWGVLYMRTGSLVPPILSHIVWTELVFVYAPLQ